MKKIGALVVLDSDDLDGSDLDLVEVPSPKRSALFLSAKNEQVIIPGTEPSRGVHTLLVNTKLD